MEFTIDKIEAEETIAEKLFFTAVATEGMPTAQRVFRSGLKNVTPKELYDRFAIHPTVVAQNESLRKSMIEEMKKKHEISELHSKMKVWDGDNDKDERDRNSMRNYAQMYHGGQQNSYPIPSKFPAYSEQAVSHFSITSNHLPHEEMYLKEMEIHVQKMISQPQYYGNKSKKEHEKYFREQNKDLIIQHATAHGVSGKVVFHDLAEFMKEIPDRVMQSYLSACELGFKEFLVAEPIIEKAHHTIGITVQDETIGVSIPKTIDPVLIGVLNGVMFEIDYWE